MNHISRHIQFTKESILSQIEEDLSNLIYTTPDPWNTEYIYYLGKRDLKRANKELDNMEVRLIPNPEEVKTRTPGWTYMYSSYGPVVLRPLELIQDEDPQNNRNTRVHNPHKVQD